MDTNTTTINGKPVPSIAQELIEHLALDRDALAERIRQIRCHMAKGETADARRSIARVIAQVMSDCPIEPTSVVEDLAEVLTFLDSAEYAEELAHEEL